MALRSQIDPLIKSFGYFMFNEEVFKNSLVFQLKCFVNEGKPPPSTAFYQIKLTISSGKTFKH